MLKRGLAAFVLLSGSSFAAEKAADPAQLATQLESPDVAVRRNASYELSKLGPKAKVALPALIKTLEDRDKQVWVNTMAAIAAIGPDAADALPALLAALNSKTASGQRSYYRDQVLIRASYALTRIGPAAIPSLIEGLKSPDTMMRAGSARALGGMGPAAKDAVPALIENLGHADAGVQADVIDALGNIGEAARPKLIEALAWNEPRQRSTAALALGAMGKSAQAAAAPMLARLKTETDATVQTSLLSALPRVGADPTQLIPALIEALKDEREPIRHAAINGLLTMRSAQAQIATALIALLKSPKAAESERAAYVLGRLGESAAPAVPAILQVVAKQSPPAPAFLDALVQIGEPAVTPMLVSVEKENPANLTSDHWIVKCLQQMGGLGAGPVSRNLTHPSASVRLLAARTLVELGADADPAIPALLRALDDENLHVRAAALTALVAARTPFAQLEPHLETAFKSPSPIIRAAAVEAAVRLGDDGKEFRPKVIDALKDPDESVRKTVISQLGPAFSDAVPLLVPLLADNARRPATIEALGHIGAASKPAVPQLVKLLSGASKEDRLRVLTALGQIGAAASEALPALEPARKDADAAIRIAALQATASIETKKQDRVAALVTGLDDSDRAVRRAAAEALGKLGDQAADAFTKLVALTANDADREFALTTLGQLGIRDVAKLTGLLQDSHREVQLYAVHRLDNLGRRAKEAVPAIEPLTHVSDPELARAARKAIASITLK